MSFITVSFSLTVHVRILLVETFVFQSLKAFTFAVLSTISFLGIISFAWEVIRSWFDYEQTQQLSSEEHNCWKARTASSGPPTAYEIKGGKNGPLDSYCINQFYKTNWPHITPILSFSLNLWPVYDYGHILI